MLHKTGTKEVKSEWVEFIGQLQDKICKAIEEVDGRASFVEDEWQREVPGDLMPKGNSGGGLTRIISNGNVFEKGGVNTSVVYGKLTDKMRGQLNISPSPNAGADKWFAAGLSLVIHPLNPFVPTVHCNYRMFELYNESDGLTDRWFGGGTDLTPYYLFEEDCTHFHQTYKNVCDDFDPFFYPKFKKDCDDYFVNKHRHDERRGIGGIFYDHRRPDEKYNVDFWMNFGKSCGNAFMEAYLPIVDRRKHFSFTDKNKHWQEIRRGRYVEFNLIHDRGTLFGLKSGGRIESILMSLPPTARFEYDDRPEPGSEEDRLLQVCLHPKDWITLTPERSSEEHF